MAVAGAWAKGRSSSRPLNFVLRMRAAAALGRRVCVALPWIDTHRVPADSLSRGVHACPLPRP
eukprot:4152117-Alexandrium_andersonii.AAC.1